MSQVPQHVAIIMDGNNRWAKKRLLPSLAGHKAGVNNVHDVLVCCIKANIKVLTLFAFSSENWRRPPLEVKGLMELFLFAIRREVKSLHKNNICLRIIGDLSQFDDILRQEIINAQNLTANNTGCILQIAANYGGKWDITQAAQKIACKVQRNELVPADINTDLIEQHLITGNLPAVDFCIRTGGEKRISNFLLWQMAYAELYFVDTLWPDFGTKSMQQALQEYAKRYRLFGKTRQQVI